MPCVLSENCFTKIFSKSLKIKIRHCKNFQYPLNKISLHYQTVFDQRLTVTHLLFSWTSIGPSKRPIDYEINLPIENALESKARSLLPTVQLDFSWTLEMPDQ